MLQTTMNRVASSLVLAAILLAGGCSRGPAQSKVTGNVTYQGQPVAQGEIIFADDRGGVAPAFATIADGRYELQTVAGKKTVRITASKETGKMIEGAMGAKFPERIDLIPPKYNTASTLVRTVEANGECVLDFPLD
jgi:hypothetical protein